LKHAIVSGSARLLSTSQSEVDSREKIMNFAIGHNDKRYTPVQPQHEPSPFERLRDFAPRIVAVPKADIDEQEAEYQRQRKKRKVPLPQKAGTT
jgi:hypothetical protein